MPRRESLFGISPHMPKMAEIPITAIRENPYQPRKTLTQESIDQLAANIKEKGLLFAPVVIKSETPDIYFLAAGQRRLKAVEKLGWETIPVNIIDTGNTLEIALIENLQREDPHPMDVAESITRLAEEFDYTHQQIANIIGERRTTVTEWLSVSKLPEDVKQQCRALDISKAHLVALARTLDRPDDMRQLWERIQGGERISSRELQRHQRGGTIGAPPTPNVPRELKPVIRIIKSTIELHEALRKIQPATLAGHSEKLDELKALHQQIGRVIAKLTKQSRSATIPDIEEAEDMSGLPEPETGSANDGANANSA